MYLINRIAISIFVCLLITGCATPATTLKNPTTGQVVRCGGDATGSMVGGLIGYNIQKSNDKDCVSSYEALGFKRL
jgi:uncharacterized protein YcfJ